MMSLDNETSCTWSSKTISASNQEERRKYTEGRKIETNIESEKRAK